MSTFTVETELVLVRCGGCGVSFGLEANYHAERKKDKKSWRCPNGCERHYGESEADRLRASLAKETARLDQMRAERDRHAAELARQKKRVGNGVCPCCQRSFTNLRRHMATKHPAFGKEGAAQ
jgi:hypothetical protein